MKCGDVRCALGTVRVIGELCTAGLIASRITSDCLVILLGDVHHPYVPNLEVCCSNNSHHSPPLWSHFLMHAWWWQALCVLLPKCGKTLELDRHSKSFMNQFFESLGQLSSSVQSPSRIRSMISVHLLFSVGDVYAKTRKDL
jgi:hypothetical protein